MIYLSTTPLRWFPNLQPPCNDLQINNPPAIIYKSTTPCNDFPIYNPLQWFPNLQPPCNDLPIYKLNLPAVISKSTATKEWFFNQQPPGNNYQIKNLPV